MQLVACVSLSLVPVESDLVAILDEGVKGGVRSESGTSELVKQRVSFLLGTLVHSPVATGGVALSDGSCTTLISEAVSLCVTGVTMFGGGVDGRCSGFRPLEII